jgi:phosphoenolpyruvate-protein phosphotransferase (PTS system enzyme I)
VTIGTSEQETVFRGIPVSSGVCHGPVIVVGPRTFQVPEYEISETGIPAEIQRFKRALIKTREELQKIQRELFDKVQTNEAGIFDAHILVLEDQTIIDEVTRLVSDDRMNVEAAFDRITRKFTSALSAVEDNYLRERAADMKDVADRVMGNLLGGRDLDPLSEIKVPSIIIGHDLSPSMTALFDREMVLGFATDIGSPTSHTAILARSLNLPSVVALRDVSSRLTSGQQVLLDGYDGLVIQNPSEQTLFQYGEVVRQHADFENQLETIRDFSSETLDGAPVQLMTNIDHPNEVGDVQRFGAEGVGLFRTEYLFLNCSELPDEEQQFEAYRSAAVQLEGGALLIRTLDLGADKVANAVPDLHEANPALGLRAIRFCLQHPVIFKQQLRAILRASAFGSVQLLYPMISNLDELLAANKLLEECRHELRRERVSFDEAMPIGIMIETPAAAMIADILAQEIDFFSIGTNDLIQYGSAVDRLNEKIADLYQPTHPGILRLIKQVVCAADEANVSVGVCGEMAGDPFIVPLLVGLGVRHLSVSAPLAPPVKYVIRKLEVPQAVALANQALSSKTSNEVMSACKRLIAAVAPDLDA